MIGITKGNLLDPNLSYPILATSVGMLIVVFRLSNHDRSVSRIFGVVVEPILCLFYEACGTEIQ